MHEFILVSTGVTAEQPITILENGDVQISGPTEITDWDGPDYIYCNTCQMRIFPGEHGLALDWELT